MVAKKRTRALRKRSFGDTQLVKIRNFFTDDFFITDLHAQKTHQFFSEFLR
jgi:hypothetical protein